MRKIAIAAALWILPASAQWLEFPTPGIPRTTDGKPNLSAPAPRLAGAHPDLTGLWVMPLETAVGNVGVRNPGDLMPADIQPWAQALVKQRAPAIDKSVFPGTQGGPLVHIIAAKAVCFRQAMTPAFVEYSRQVIANAKALAAGLAEGGCRVVSGGTDTHLMLVDVWAKGVRGKEAETALDRAHITANKNAIPFDTNPPLNPSGLRFGSPAVTTRGFREPEMRSVAELIVRVLENISSEEVQAEVRRKVEALTTEFPLYAWKLGAVGVR